MNVNHAIDLNVSATGMPPVLKMAQYDANSRTIVATLWNGASKFVIPSDASVMVRFGKPDGTGGLYDETEAGDAVTFADNVVTAPVASQMLSVAGKVQADIEIYQTGETEQAAVKLATFCFVVNVERAAYQDADMISSDYYNIIAGQIQQAILAGVNAAQNATDAEAWAVGKRNGVEVGADDPAHHNNAKYYKDQAQELVSPLQSIAVTLPAASWDTETKTQTVTATGVTETANCIVTAAPASYVAYGEAWVRCTAQGAGTLTFACETVPTEDLTANVLILG